MKPYRLYKYIQKERQTDRQIDWQIGLITISSVSSREIGIISPISVLYGSKQVLFFDVKVAFSERHHISLITTITSGDRGGSPVGARMRGGSCDWTRVSYRHFFSSSTFFHPRKELSLTSSRRPALITNSPRRPQRSNSRAFPPTQTQFFVK